MPATRTPGTFRLPDETWEKIRAIATAREGLTNTRVIELGVDRLHREVCGRNAADLKPVRQRKAKPK